MIVQQVWPVASLTGQARALSISAKSASQVGQQWTGCGAESVARSVVTLVSSCQLDTRWQVLAMFTSSVSTQTGVCWHHSTANCHHKCHDLVVDFIHDMTSLTVTASQNIKKFHACCNTVNTKHTTKLLDVVLGVLTKTAMIKQFSM